MSKTNKSMRGWLILIGVVVLLVALSFLGPMFKFWFGLGKRVGILFLALIVVLYFLITKRTPGSRKAKK